MLARCLPKAVQSALPSLLQLTAVGATTRLGQISSVLEAASSSQQTGHIVSYGAFLRSYAAPSLKEKAAQALAGLSAKPGIIVDSTAVNRLKQLQAETPDKPVYLRIEVDGGGCSGYQYKFSLDSTTNEEDQVFENDGSKVVTDTTSLEFLQGAKLEFEDTLMRSGFLISNNPNSESTCGCGSSFVAKSKK